MGIITTCFRHAFPIPTLFILSAVTSLARTGPESPAQRAVGVLRENCLQCHGESSGMSGLKLLSRELILKGGTRGAALIPGDGRNSLLFKAVSRTGEPHMPPGKRLSVEDVEALRIWIDAGASWPKDGEPSPTSPTRASSWWSFRRPQRPRVPDLVDSWIRTPIDAFILEKLKSQGLKPTLEADRFTLIRRAYFDLHGLPPTAEQVRAFLNNLASDAYEKLIDELLESPRYGEKWGRHWLDLVRYGDTAGFEQDPYLLYAWRYRDYVIKSLNDDKPYDRFVKEQIAEDEIWPDDPEKLYGIGKPLSDDFGRKCLLARRLVERGVRFIQLYSGTNLGDDWDNAHYDLVGSHNKMAAKTDKPIAGLLTDLKSRGLLDSTLVVWSGEFGRTPLAEGKNGRDHHPYGFSMWLAGGGVKGGQILGATDELGLRAVDGPFDTHDVNATILRLLGIDHTKLTYFYQSRDQRLTDVHGEHEFTTRLLQG